MTIINKLFFELIRVAIGTQACLSHTPSADEWGELYAMAKKQSLVGICFAGVQKLQKQEQCPHEMLYLQWMGMAAKIQQRNEVVNRQCVEVQKRLSEAAMRSSILKGQGIAALYKLRDESLELIDMSGLRQSGDIDVYVDCGREKAIEYARSIQDEVDWDYKHLHLKVFKDTEVEMHYVPEVFLNLRKNKKLHQWFNEPLVQSSIFQVSGEFVTPSAEFITFYILLHIYRHFLYEGVGLRQLMDYYFVLRSQIMDERLIINDDMLRLLKEFGMMRFTRGVVWVMKSVFGLEKGYLICEPDETEGRYILNKVMMGGNFGHHDERLSGGSEGKIGTVKRIVKHNMHLLTHYPEDTLWTPIWIVYHWCWKRLNNK